MEDISVAGWRKSTHSGANGGQCVEVGAAEWRKSTYSGGNGGACVEVGVAGWRKSTYSGGNGGQCVEAGNARAAVAVRDTTDRDGVMLTIPAVAWREFTSALK